jgi:hypothetical protein
VNKIHKGKVVKGKFIPQDPTSFRLAFAKREGKPVEVVVQSPKKHRSGNQNRYYWGIVIDIISGATGFTPQEAHDAMRVKFLTDMEGELPRVKSTTELSTVQFMDYVAQIQQFGAEYLEVYIPEPDEVSL